MKGGFGASLEDNPKIETGELGSEGANYTRHFRHVQGKNLSTRQMIFGFYENWEYEYT
jgi:hypothetical protein